MPDTQQDRLAQFLLNEWEEDERWTASTAAHAVALERRILDVLADDALGTCEPLNPDAL